MVKSCICHACGCEVELQEDDRPCDVLSGWLMLSCVRCNENIDRYSFCSRDCLRAWLDAQLADIPEVFLDCLNEDDGEV
jgi:hypothetical protein